MPTGVRSRVRVIMVDNFDSFTFNLVDEFARRGAAVEVWRNTTEAAHICERAAAGDGSPLIVISPGPGRPEDAGCSVALVRLAEGRFPIFGVCLGHQAIVEAYGGQVDRAGAVVHGKTSRVTHDGRGLFHGLPSPLTVGRYHSLAARALPDTLACTAECDGLIMAAEHRQFPTAGIQFHAESILTPDGGRLIDNVLTWAEASNAGR